VFGMPAAAVELGGVSRLLNSQAIASAILQQVQEGKRL